MNWESQFSGTNRNLESIYFIDSVTAFTAGQDGTVLKTTNGGITLIEQTSNIINDFLLYQNYPNPFNNSTIISYSVPVRSNIELKIFNALGQSVRSLESGVQQPGLHTISMTTEDLPSGVYFYSLKVNNTLFATKKLILIK